MIKKIKKIFLEIRHKRILSKYNNRTPCPDCGSFHKNNHHPHCSFISDKQKLEGYIQYYEAWLRENEERHHMYDKFRKELTFWQGKFRIVKHENNKLRKRIYKKENKDEN